MKVKIFMPQYMTEFKCIASQCPDTCCAGWDINIDESTYSKYKNSTGEFKELLNGKFIENKKSSDYFNHGFMVLKDENRCPFLNSNMLCDIHGSVGEESLCITCTNYPRVFNIIDDVYEKSALPSCHEVCVKGFLNKDKMEFIELEEDINEDKIEIRRIIDSEAFQGSESLIQYFWDIRVISINIIQNRAFSIDERLNILKNFYNTIEELYTIEDFDGIEDILDEFNDGLVDYNEFKEPLLEENIDFYNCIAGDNIINNIKSVNLKQCVTEYKNGLLKDNNLDNHNNEVEEYSYIMENYIVNQIFKNLIPFNKGNDLNKSITMLISSYKIIRAYVIGIAVNSGEEITDKLIIRVIQALSKDIEHNKVFEKLLESI